jgi:hypothetical protein
MNTIIHRHQTDRDFGEIETNEFIPPSKQLNIIIPIGLLLLTLQLPVGLLQLIGQYFQISGQLVFGLEFLGQQHQVTGGIVQRHIGNCQPFSGITQKMKNALFRLFKFQTVPQQSFLVTLFLAFSLSLSLSLSILSLLALQTSHYTIVCSKWKRNKNIAYCNVILCFHVPVVKFT